MINFLGEFELKIDAKKRVMLPATLKKQLNGEDHFVINRAFDKCLNLYPYSVWQQVDADLSKLNQFVKKERDFVRYVRGGASEIILDGQGRFAVPSRLMEYASISSEIILLGNGSLIEVWDLATYENYLNIDADDFSSLAEEVMVKYEEEDLFEYDESIVVPIMRR